MNLRFMKVTLMDRKAGLRARSRGCRPPDGHVRTRSLLRGRVGGTKFCGHHFRLGSQTCRQRLHDADPCGRIPGIARKRSRVGILAVVEFVAVDLPSESYLVTPRVRPAEVGSVRVNDDDVTMRRGQARPMPDFHRVGLGNRSHAKIDLVQHPPGQRGSSLCPRIQLTTQVDSVRQSTLDCFDQQRAHGIEVPYPAQPVQDSSGWRGERYAAPVDHGRKEPRAFHHCESRTLHLVTVRDQQVDELRIRTALKMVEASCLETGHDRVVPRQHQCCLQPLAFVRLGSGEQHDAR